MEVQYNVVIVVAYNSDGDSLFLFGWKGNLRVDAFV